MKTLHSFNGTLRLTGLFSGLAITVLGGFVTETAQEFITTADLDGDGQPDIVVVDKSSGTFRAGYQFSADVFTWSDSRALGGTNITGVTTGPITDTSYDAIAVASPFMNRVHLIEATKDVSPAFPIPVFGNELGPKTVVSQEIGGGTAESDLVVINALSSPNPNRLERIESSGTLFNPLGAATVTDAWVRGNSIPFLGSNESAAFIDRSQNALRMYEFSSGALNHLDSIFFGGALTSPDYCPIHPDPLDYVHYIVWDPGTETAYRFYMEPGETFSSLEAIDLQGKINSVQTVNADGMDWLLATYSNGSAAIFSYDAKLGPAFQHEMPPAPEGLIYSAALQTGPDRFTLLSADEGTGLSGDAEIFEFTGSEFEGTGSFTLPPVTASRGKANVFTFRNEPFVDSSPERLQSLNTGDWSTDAQLGNFPLEIDAEFEIDQGLPDGLGNTDSLTLGLADTSAKFTLVNQAGIPYSVYSTEASTGFQGAEAFINPSPGHYRTGIEVTFTNSTGDDIYYQLSGSTTWDLFSSAIPLFKTETLLYYAESPGGQRSPIQSATFTFEVDPGDLDSDGDSIPDYVELANGLNPIASGIDGDGDGFSDLEELIAGSDPTDPGDVPTLPIPGTSGRLEQLSTFDLHVTPIPYDGTADTTTLCQTGSALRAYSGAGWQYAYDVTLNHGLGGITDPSVLLTNLPSSIEAGFFTLLTDQHFPISTAFSNENIGIEMASVMTPPVFQTLEVSNVYAGGDLTSESTAWISAAFTAVTNTSVPVVSDELTTDDVLKAMLTERKMMDEMFLSGIITNRYASLFPGRPSDNTMISASAADFQALENSTNIAFLPSTVIAEIGIYLSETNSAPLRSLAEELYDVCSELSDADPGLYPLPITVLRVYLLNGTLNSNYAAQVSLNNSDLDQAYDQATNFLAGISPRMIEQFMLEVQEDSFSNACPVLYTSGGTGKSLYDSEGRPYIMPFSFNLGAGAEVTARAFTDVVWNRVPGTDPIEIISLSLTAVPVSSDTDANGNLIPDALEDNLLVSPGSPSHLDSDGDGYSDLQEYLDGSDPSDPLSTPAGAIVDLSPPEVIITSLGGGQVELSVQWPFAYADPFIFSVIYSDDLGTPGFSTDHELAEGELTSILNTSSSDARFFKIGMQLR